MRRSIFNPQGRKSAQNPQSGGESNSITRQVINAIFGRTPLFFNAGLADYISPVVDSTLYFPLDYQIKREQRDAVVAGTIHSFQVKPPVGKHWMITYMTVGMPGGGGVGALSSAVLSMFIVPEIAQILAVQDFPATLPSVFDVGNLAPLIGAKRAGVDNATVPGVPYNFMYEGIKSLYVNANTTVWVVVNQNPVVIPNIVELFYTILELPDNQPFGPALTM